MAGVSEHLRHGLVEQSPAAGDDMHGNWARSLSDEDLADQVDGVAAGQLTPAERAAVLVEAARRLRGTDQQKQQVAIQAAAVEDDSPDVEPTFAGWVEF
jgi:hypothetical protein